MKVRSPADVDMSEGSPMCSHVAARVHVQAPVHAHVRILEHKHMSIYIPQGILRPLGMAGTDH